MTITNSNTFDVTAFKNTALPTINSHDTTTLNHPSLDDTPLCTGDVIECIVLTTPPTTQEEHNTETTYTTNEYLLITAIDDKLQTISGYNLGREQHDNRRYSEIVKQLTAYDATVHRDPFGIFPSRPTQ